MINSNYYGFDTLNLHPTFNQAARAGRMSVVIIIENVFLFILGNLVWAACKFRRLIERQEVSPFAIAPKTKVPFCTMQYQRLFNACRVPG